MPSTVGGLVIALCAVLLLKWLAVVALVVMSATLLGRWVWQRQRTPRWDTDGVGVETLPAPPAVPMLPRRRQAAPPSADDCSWCGLPGGHWAPDGARLRPRHAHAAR